ncbi:TrmH family RNA methyltransferase [Flavobacterium capsici]|uniref:RNA methyltransferase n=1 Tax=Flavobacterium capsici TaxID=3075618 RepID=A0AA96J439_9FLAO|nr:MULTISPECIES: RNA methyltransferase [unclassified Flavobacterium]WNM19998.1 RNA methyltransferase [Flavobacterium sp. PMR2A8]WNM21387.1 RNA methyltransferase [Flavobacterium sp. PMTSA4]
MVSKNQIKLINSLQQKKYRNEHQLFIAEGVKVIQELLQSNIVLEHLFATSEIFSSFDVKAKTEVSTQEMKKISALTTPSSCLALFKIPSQNSIEKSGLIVALDDIRDPGNLGTIVRLCDWFGVTQIVCSKETVDLYNPKVVQATMGSIARVKVNYLDLNKFISESSLPVFGTFMDGKNIYKEALPNEGIIVFGNEANGISSEIGKNIKKRIAIPQFGEIQETESLNVATATAIVLSEFRRKN